MRYFLKISSLLIIIVPLFYSCSTIQVTSKLDENVFLDEMNYMKLKGTYTDSTIVDYQKSVDTTRIVYAPCKVILEPLTPKKIKYQYFVNDSLMTERILKGRFKKGYFMQRTKFVVEFVYGPLLWGPGSENYAYGITTENNLIFREAHGGLAFFLIVPFFGSGGNSQDEYKRID